jgi:hypothetical protein
MMWAAVALTAVSARVSAQAPAQAALPSGREVIDRSVKASGGEAAFAKHKSRYTKGTFSLEGKGISGSMEVFAMRPARQLAKIDMPGFGLSIAAYDGKIGWSIDPALGPRLLSGKELDRMKLLAEFDSGLHRSDQFAVLETLERTAFEGRDCYKVLVKGRSGVEWTEFYDTKTGLMAGMVGDQESPMGTMSITTVMDGYKEFGGVLLPTITIQRMAGLGAEVKMTIDSVEYDKVEDSVFEMPAAIKTLAGR